MTKISFLELIIRGIPESLIFFLAAHAFSKNAIKVKKYLLSSILFTVIVYFVRLLPIHNGIVFILNLLVLISLSVYINRFAIIEAIKASILVMLVMFICEGMNVFVLQFVLNKDLEVIFEDRMLKILYSAPSILVFGVIALVFYIRLQKRNGLKSNYYGEVNK